MVCEERSGKMDGGIRNYLFYFSPAPTLSNMFRLKLRSKETSTYAKTFKPAKKSRVR